MGFLALGALAPEEGRRLLRGMYLSGSPNFFLLDNNANRWRISRAAVGNSFSGAEPLSVGKNFKLGLIKNSLVQ